MAIWLFPAPRQTSLLFDKIKPFLASGLISHNGEKVSKICSTISNDWGTHFAGQVVQTSARNSTSFLETKFSLKSSVIGKNGRTKG